MKEGNLYFFKIVVIQSGQKWKKVTYKFTKEKNAVHL